MRQNVMDQQGEIRMGRRAGYWRAIGLAVLVGVLGGLLLLPVTGYALTVAQRLPLLYAPVAGAWFLPVVTAMVVVGRPGAGVVAGAVAGLVMSIASPIGLQAIPGMIVLGLVIELTLAARLYRRWGNRILAVGIGIACFLHALSAWRRLDLVSLGIPAQLAFAALLLISALGTLVLARLAARMLEGTALTRGLGPRSTPAQNDDRVAAGAGWQYDGGLARKPDTTP
jgi:ABC-type thiamin/hydroxymethylpyrimidine transport system permease subunit